MRLPNPAGNGGPIDAALAAAPSLAATVGARATDQFRTVDDLRRLAAEIGVSRLANVTKLDRIAAFNFYAIRPAARYPDAIYASGKGFTPFEAQTKAIFEAYERWAAEAPALCFDATPTALADAAAHANAVIYLAHELAPDTPVRWAIGRRLFDSAIALAPEPMITFPASDFAYPLASTTGLAGHGSQVSAIETAILELLERNAATALAPDRLQRVTVDAVSASSRRLLDSMAAEDIECVVFRIDHGTSLAVQVAYAFAFDHWLGLPQSHCSGFGAALALADATDKALLEVSQSRSAFITGMRDDVARHVSPKSIDIVRLERQRAWLEQLRGVQSIATVDPSRDSVLEVIGRAVRNGHLNEPAVFPLRAAAGAEAVRVVIPGLLEAL